MGVFVDHKEQLFYLQTPTTTYVMKLTGGRYLTHVYWGKKLFHLNKKNAFLNRMLAFSAVEEGDGETYTRDFIRGEYPTGGGTDHRFSALGVTFPDGSWDCQLEYVGFEAIAGKEKVPGLPSLYVEEEAEAETLKIFLKDPLWNLQVTLYYTVFKEYDVIVRRARVSNGGDQPVFLNRFLSASLDFEQDHFDLLSFPGAWGRERHMEKAGLRSGITCFGSNRGASSHQMNPLLILEEKGGDEDHGAAYAMNLIYSGNFLAGTEVDQLHQTRFFMGMGDDNFSWKLAAGEELDSPEVVLAFSSEGLGSLSRTFHDLYRNHLVRGKYKKEARPILVNNWEATYFDFNEEKILAIADAARDLGIELFVLDDGWFGEREDDSTSLGDWFVNTKKLPSGIQGLAEKIHQRGLKFGLWFEPEMVSKVSKLYEIHPDWCIHVKNRKRTECRNQLILDLSREEVCDYITNKISGILDSAEIDYVKWDMNRHMTEIGSCGLSSDRQKELPHRYMLGLYKIMEAITQSHPDILFESCSGGGGRFDPGLLYYMPQAWTSDDTDGIERLKIQYGSSFAYPLSAMGSHVSAVPNHQTGRVTPLKLRMDVAMSGNYGFELDLSKQSEEDLAAMKESIALAKDLRSFLPFGDFYRLLSPYQGGDTAWQVVSKDGQRIFAAYFQVLSKPNPGICRLKLKGLDASAFYLDEENGEIYSGGELMELGLVVSLYGDYQSKTWLFRRKDDYEVSD